jgi:aliphatic nitrilase
MDSVGHYARPELLSLVIDDRPNAALTSRAPVPEPAAPGT